jgi:hypothetical protein
LLHRISLDPRPLGHLDGELDRTLVLLLDRMARRNVKFDPSLTVLGAEALDSTGAILISGHFFLNNLFLRWLHDRGRRVSIIMTTRPARTRFIGTDDPMEIIEADSLCLLRARRRVAEGGIVGIPVDCISHLDGTPSIDSPYGKLFLPQNVMRFAERAGIPLLFVATHVTRDGLVVTNLVRPSSTQADSVYQEFCQFMLSQFV